MCVGVWLAHISVYRVHAWDSWRPERVSETLELELQVVMSHYVGTWN